MKQVEIANKENIMSQCPMCYGSIELAGYGQAGSLMTVYRKNQP